MSTRAARPLAVATPEERKALFQALGLSLVYDPVEDVVHAQQDLASCWGSQSVGGPIAADPDWRLHSL
jgi:hypothetical protein